MNDTVCSVAADADIVITTARIFGRPAPITVPSSAVASFKSGAVIVDMNADVGGNCENTKPGEIYTTDNERRETFEDAQSIYKEIEKAYLVSGYRPIKVPLGSTSNRIKFILKKLNE